MKSRGIHALAVAVVVVAVASAGAETPPNFSSHWHDGKAELNGYRLEISRYGQTREGRAVMVYVTEPFSDAKRVKVNDPSKRPDDTVDVIKLNFVRDFQTGIYDYNTMVSTFARTSDFEPMKVSFTSAEWCGHVYQELRFDEAAVTGDYFSYFEGESGPVELKRPADGVVEDNLFILLRGLRGDYLAPGESKEVAYLPGVLHSRLSHEPMAWTRARISRASASETVDVPAGSFETVVYTVEVDGGRDGVFHVERDYPHRIVEWSLAPDVRGTLLGSKRLAYWMLNREGQESYLGQIGLGEPAK